MFLAAEVEEPFRQGEIIAALVDYIFDPELAEVSEIAYEFGVVLAQDCDLQRYHESQPIDDAPVLIFPASDAATGRATAGLNTKEWRTARQNNNPRYHVLHSCPVDCDSGDGIPDLMIDFRRYFVLQHAQLAKQVNMGDAVRRSKLIAPYREHLQSRAMHYLSRVPLDPPHNVA